MDVSIYAASRRAVLTHTSLLVASKLRMSAWDALGFTFLCHRMSYSALALVLVAITLALPSATAQCYIASNCDACATTKTQPGGVQQCIWCSSDSLQTKTNGVCVASTIGQTCSATAQGGLCNLGDLVKGISDLVRTIVIVIVVIHVVNLAAITFAAHKTVCFSVFVVLVHPQHAQHPSSCLHATSVAFSLFISPFTLPFRK